MKAHPTAQPYHNSHPTPPDSTVPTNLRYTSPQPQATSTTTQTSRTMPSDKTVNRTITINAPVSEVWQALTNPDLAREWLSPERTTNVTSDWQLGSQIIYAGTWHRRRYADKGTILQLDPERTLQYSYWSQFSRLPDSPENYSVIGFQLTPNENGTTLTL